MTKLALARQSINSCRFSNYGGLPKSAFVTLKIYNLLGEEVATLIAEQRVAGNYRFNWDVRGLASGVYLYRLEAGDFVQVKKLILMQ